MLSTTPPHENFYVDPFDDQGTQQEVEEPNSDELVLVEVIS